MKAEQLDAGEAVVAAVVVAVVLEAGADHQYPEAGADHRHLEAGADHRCLGAGADDLRLVQERALRKWEGHAPKSTDHRAGGRMSDAQPAAPMAIGRPKDRTLVGRPAA